MSLPPVRLPGPLPVAVAVAAGIAFAALLDRAGFEPALRWVIAVSLAIAAYRYRQLAIVAVIAAGAARGARPAAEPPAGATLDDRLADRIAGEIDGPVVRTARGFGARLATGETAVWMWTDEAVAPGERIAVTGLLRTPRGTLGPAQPDRADAIATRGARFEIVARRIERLADTPGPAARVWRWAAATQAAWAARIEHAGGDPAARAALAGIAVGARAGVPAALDERWRAVGIYHILSVSGLHLAVIAGLAFTLLRRLIAASPWGGRVRPARWAAPPAFALAIAYTLVTGAQLATLRALVVITLVLVAAMFDRPLRLVDAVAFAAIAILAWRPADLFDPSFQLSFTAALTLAIKPPSERRGVIGWIVRGFATSAWITITTAPITAYHFQQVAPGGVIGNLVLTPIVELLALPLSLAGLVIGWDAPVALATWLVSIVDRIAGELAHGMPIGRIALAGAATVAVLVAIALWLVARPRRTRLDALAWVALCAGWALGRTPPPAGALRVTFLDVGQGDAALIELPDGAVWLVDAGGHASARDLASASAPGRTIARTLAVYGHARVDLAIISHPHPDHYLGLAALAVPIREVWSAWEPEPPPRSRTPLPGFPELVAALAPRGTRLAHPPLGVARAQAGVELVVWGPRYQAIAGGAVVEAADPVRSVNDNSLVVEVRYRGRSILFAGDLEAEGEEALVAAGVTRVDVVKVAHHGSPTSSTPQLVAATRPALAVISCGRANQFGFPAPPIVARWREVGADIARTDLEGAITVTVDATGALAVERFAPAAP